VPPRQNSRKGRSWKFLSEGVLQFDILTLFPSFFASPFSASLIGKARDEGLLTIRVHDLREFTTDRHRKVDDVPYGGGPGMVMKPEPAVAALERTSLPGKKIRKIYLSPQGRLLKQDSLKEYCGFDQLILLCGRYEGIDERILGFVDEEISIGDYVLSGGEVAAIVFVEAVSRLIPGVVGTPDSLILESFSEGLLEYPHYTRPEEFRGDRVPSILLSGDHRKIAAWRREQSVERTRRKRPDLLKK